MPNFPVFEDIGLVTAPGRVLYHGSRGGIVGRIEPTGGRRTADLGAGFYIGTDPMQVKALVAGDPQPVCYALSVDFSGITGEQILVLEPLDWAYTVLHNRGRCRPFMGSHIDEAIASFTEGHDFVVGPIADDWMNAAVRRFADNALTDEGLLACLSSIRYGTQIVAKTQEACDRVEVIAEQPIYEDEAADIRAWCERKVSEARRVVDRMQTLHKGHGHYLSELLEMPYEPKEKAVANQPAGCRWTVAQGNPLAQKTRLPCGLT